MIPAPLKRKRVSRTKQASVHDGINWSIMRYTVYEHPVTHKFALVRLPDKFVDDDELPILPTERWFDNREDAIAAVPELLNREA